MGPRQLLGYGRLEEPELLAPINSLYRETWGPLHSFFLPSMKLVKKCRQGSRWVLQHDMLPTACPRLLPSGQLTAKARRQLRHRFEALDPFVFAQEAERCLKPILAAPLEQ